MLGDGSRSSCSEVLRSIHTLLIDAYVIQNPEISIQLTRVAVVHLRAPYQFLDVKISKRWLIDAYGVDSGNIQTPEWLAKTVSGKIMIKLALLLDTEDLDGAHDKDSGLAVSFGNRLCPAFDGV